jgi:hypothetical protein
LPLLSVAPSLAATQLVTTRLTSSTPPSSPPL